MDEEILNDHTSLPLDPAASPVRSLRELLDRVSGRAIRWTDKEGDSGRAEVLPFPFLALIGQVEMKLALLMAVINPGIGGVLLIGPRGTGKTTAVRSLVELLPQAPRSRCYYGCMPEDIETGGMDAVCPDCAKKYAEGESLTTIDNVRLLELPLSSQLEDVVGGIDEHALGHEKLRLRRGILAQADRNLLYIDEVNLLPDEVVDSILDAASQGSYTVRRGLATATYRSQFILIGSMNPEEGRLRPQIMDRFGLRITVKGLNGPQAMQDRLEAYRRVQAYQANPRQMISQYAEDMALVREEIQAARNLLPEVTLPDEVAHCGLEMICKLQIDSLRAEIALFEAARAFTAMDGRLKVTVSDINSVALMALRMRRSPFMKEFFANQDVEERELSSILKSISNKKK
jgi:magnesium chelatase subunit I